MEEFAYVKLSTLEIKLVILKISNFDLKIDRYGQKIVGPM